MNHRPSPSTNPSLLQALALPGNEVAWTDFVTLYGPVIQRNARKVGLNPDDIDDVTSRVMAALTTALKELRYDPARRFRGYLRTAVVNGAKRLARERHRRPGDRASGTEAERSQLAQLETQDPFGELGDSIEADLSARMQLVRKAIETVRESVTPATWDAYWQTAIEMKPAQDVAVRLGKNVGAIYMAKSRVIGLLKQEGQRLLEGSYDEGFHCDRVSDH